jgi:hypothetical protein
MIKLCNEIRHSSGDNKYITVVCSDVRNAPTAHHPPLVAAKIIIIIIIVVINRVIVVVVDDEDDDDDDDATAVVATAFPVKTPGSGGRCRTRGQTPPPWVGGRCRAGTAP